MSREINNSNETTIERVIMAGIDEALTNIHTMTIAKVTKVESKTINVKPVFNRVVNGVSIELPEFISVPVVNIQGGGSYLHMPITVGDYAMLFFAERCTDSWYAGQDFKAPLEYRIHDYSDGFALVGVNPEANAITIPDVITQIGDTYFKGNHEHDGTLLRNGNTTINGDVNINGNVKIDGNLEVTGTISASNFTGIGGGSLQTSVDIVSGGISLQEHTHTSNGAGAETSNAN